MRTTSILLLAASVVTVASATAVPVVEGRAQKEVERRYVGVWGGHEKDVYKPSKLKKGKKGKGKGKGKKYEWWNWPGDDDDDDDEVEENPEVPSVSLPVVLPVETPEPEVKPPVKDEDEEEDKEDSEVTILPIFNEDGTIKIEDDPETSTTEPLSTIRLTSTQAGTRTITRTASASPTSTTPIEEPTPVVVEPVKQVALLPTYPSHIDNPVDPNSWLMQWASQVTPYWNYTEVLWAPCERVNKPIPDASTCKPTCADIHSHTRLSVFLNCNRLEICTFATFVLPDSACPGRVNSYLTRCAQSQEKLNSANNNRLIDGKYRLTADLVASMRNGTHPPISECIARAAATPKRSLPIYTGTTSLSPRSLSTSLTLYSRRALHKRVYVYRSYLNSLNMARNIMLTGPGDFYCPANFDGSSTVCPFDCFETARTVFMESIVLNGTQYALCTYPMETLRAPDERCPGVGSPEENCPGTEEELVAFFVKEMKGKKTEEEILEMLRVQREEGVGCKEGSEPKQGEDLLQCTPVKNSRRGLQEGARRVMKRLRS